MKANLDILLTVENEKLQDLLLKIAAKLEYMPKKQANNQVYKFINMVKDEIGQGSTLKVSEPDYQKSLAFLIDIVHTD